MSRPGGAQLLKVRLDAPPAVVAIAAVRLRRVLDVVRESADYPNRPPSTGVRRYLDVVIDGDDLVAGEIGRRG